MLPVPDVRGFGVFFGGGGFVEFCFCLEGLIEGFTNERFLFCFLV